MEGMSGRSITSRRKAVAVLASNPHRSLITFARPTDCCRLGHEKTKSIIIATRHPSLRENRWGNRLIVATNEEFLYAIWLTRPLMHRRFRVAGIKTINTLLPHLHEDSRGNIFNGLPSMFDFRKCIFPDCSLAPLFTLLFALVCSAH